MRVKQPPLANFRYKFATERALKGLLMRLRLEHAPRRSIQRLRRESTESRLCYMEWVQGEFVPFNGSTERALKVDRSERQHSRLARATRQHRSLPHQPGPARWRTATPTLPPTPPHMPPMCICANCHMHIHAVPETSASDAPRTPSAKKTPLQPHPPSCSQ